MLYIWPIVDDSLCQSYLSSWMIQRESIHIYLLSTCRVTIIASLKVCESFEIWISSIKDSILLVRSFCGTDCPQQWLRVRYLVLMGRVLLKTRRTFGNSPKPTSTSRVGRNSDFLWHLSWSVAQSMIHFEKMFVLQLDAVEWPRNSSLTPSKSVGGKLDRLMT